MTEKERKLGKKWCKRIKKMLENIKEDNNDC